MKQFTFTVELAGTGETEEEAWADAVEGEAEEDDVLCGACGNMQNLSEYGSQCIVCGNYINC